MHQHGSLTLPLAAHSFQAKFYVQCLGSVRAEQIRHQAQHSQLPVDKKPSPTLSQALWDFGELGGQELESHTRTLPGRDGVAKPYVGRRGSSPFPSWPFWKLKGLFSLFWFFFFFSSLRVWPATCGFGAWNDWAQLLGGHGGAGWGWPLPGAQGKNAKGEKRGRSVVSYVDRDIDIAFSLAPAGKNLTDVSWGAEEIKRDPFQSPVPGLTTWVCLHCAVFQCRREDGVQPPASGPAVPVNRPPNTQSHPLSTCLCLTQFPSLIGVREPGFLFNYLFVCV